MTRKQLWNMKYALPRTSTFLAIGIAALCLITTPAAFAGTKEINAITAKLPVGTTIATATATELSNATLAAIDDPANKKLSATVLAGESLKGAGDANFGSVFGAAAFASASPRISADKNKFAAGAAVSASTGKTASAVLVPAFAAQFAASNDEAQAIARLATKSSTAIGAILGGRAGEVDALQRINLANTALVDSKTKKAAQQIAQYVGDAVASDTEAAAFATSVAVANKKYLQKVAVGATTSNPNAADGIIDGLFASSASVDAKKLAPKLAKAVGLVADIEQIQLMAISLGNAVTAKQINSTAKGLIKAVSGRSPANGTGNDQLDNKGDEVGEIAAYYLAALNANAATSSKFATAKSASAFVFSLAKTMFKAAKVKKIKSTGQLATALQNELVQLPGNFGASFAMTLKALNLPADVLAAIQAKLASTKSLKAIAGKTNGPLLGNAFAAGFAADPLTNTTFENGTVTNVSMIDAPETDIRNG